MTSRPVRGLPERVYALLLHCYPPTFRRRFGRDMQELFLDRLRGERSCPGTFGMTGFWFRIMTDLLQSASSEHVAALHERLARALVPHPPGFAASSGDTMFETFLHDLRYTLRMLRKAPTFTAVAMLVIALGTGAVTTIFSGASALLLRPIPGVSDPGHLMDITRTGPDGGGGHSTTSYPYYTHVRDESKRFDGIVAWSFIQLTVSTGGQGTAAFADLVSANYFSVLGVRPAHGRFFTPDEDRDPGAHPVVVLSDGFWRRRFGADPAIVGRSILVNGSPYTVIGVAPPRFTGVYPVLRTDAWVPLMMAPQLGRDMESLTNAGFGWLTLFGRLKPGVSVAQARDELVGVTKAHLGEEPRDFDAFADIQLSTMTGFPATQGGAIRGFVLLLLVISGLVLVIASVNVAGMLLARATARRQEMAVRIAIGAGRGRLVRQLLTESLVLFLGGAIGGVLIAVWSTRLFDRIPLPTEVPISVDLSPDYRVLLFALGVALLTGIVFGLAPALQATRDDPGTSLRSDTAGSGWRRSRLRNGLVVGQMAISLLLLMSAGLFLRALGKGRQVDPGFETSGIATVALDVGTAGYSAERAEAFYSALKQRLQLVPGVTAVSYTQWLPLTNASAGTLVRVDGFVPPSSGRNDGRVPVNLGRVAPDYFAVLKLPIVRGRGFLPTDDSTAYRVAIVNETFARTYWPGRDPVGQTLHDETNLVTVVGVARDAKYSSLNEPMLPFMYLPIAQAGGGTATNLMIRTTGDAARMTPAIREAMAAIDPLLPPPVATTMEAATSVVLLPQRVAAGVTGIMGLLGLLLAVVGLYGVVSYTVGQRTREIGLRLALGADRRAVLRMIVSDGMRLVAIGVVIGLVLAVAVTRLLSRFLLGVSPLDPLVFVAIPVGLGLATLLASYLPARKAAATSPLEALRSS